MSVDHSHKLIHEIAAQREADDYVEGLLKDPAMRGDMERAASKWDSLMKDTDTIAPAPPPPSRETEIER